MLRMRRFIGRTAVVTWNRRQLSGTPASEASIKADRVARMKQASKAAAAAAASGAASKNSAKGKSSGSMAVPAMLASLAAALGLAAYAVLDIRSNPDGALAKSFRGSALEEKVTDLFGSIDSVYQPSAEKLLQNYESGSFYGQVVPGSLAPPLLVLDLERTLIGTVYDAKFGWRHVKRPGLQQFIDRMSQYYEIVILSENDIQPEIQMAIDPSQKCHHYSQAAMEMRNGQLLKRLDLMNRDLSRVVLVDDSAAASQLYPRNTLLVKPFEDVHDTRDTALDDLMVLLQALVHDGVGDVRDALDDLGTHEASEAVVEYRMRVAAVKERERQKRDKGLGGLLKKATGADKRAERDADDGLAGQSLLSKIVGASPQDVGSASGGSALTSSALKDKNIKGLVVSEKPVQTKKKGALFHWLEESAAENARLDDLKNQHLHELNMRRMKERADKEEERKRKQQYAGDEE